MVVTNKEKCAEYAKIGINTSNQELLILKCYDGILGCLHKAKGLIPARKQWPEVNNNMIKAQKGLALLADAVNEKAGGEVGTNLLKLYDFMLRYLVKANMRKDVKMIDDVIGMLTDMKESWEKAFKKLHDEAQGKTIVGNQPARKTVFNIIS